MRKRCTNKVLWSVFLVFIFSGSLLAKNISGSYSHTGDYTDESKDGLAIMKDSRMEVSGSLSVSSNIKVNKGGVLVVYGNLSCTGDITVDKGGEVYVYGGFSTFKKLQVKEGSLIMVEGNLSGSAKSEVEVKGDLLVLGNYQANKTKIEKDKKDKKKDDKKDDKDANLVVGGNFSGDKDFKPQSDNFYLLSASGNILPKTLKDSKNYGDSVAFSNDEPILAAKVKWFDKTRFWVGGKDANWFTSQNWTGNRIPESSSKVVIDSKSKHFPIITGTDEIQVRNLTLEEGAQITVSAGGTLTVESDINNKGLIVLESTFDHLASLMLPANPTDVGKTHVTLTVSKNRYWYLSSPLKDPQAGWFGELDENTSASGDWVFVLRNSADGGNRSWLKVVNNISLYKLEGVSAWYYNEDKKMEYTGTLNTGDITRTFEEAGYYMIGNPFATAIDWENPEGWNRSGFSNTMWSYIFFNGQRVLYSYNNNGDGKKGISSIDPEDLGLTNENQGYIAPYQAVWVESETANAPLTVKSKAQVTDNTVPLKGASMASSSSSSSYNLIRVKVKNQYALDGAVIYFDEGFESGLDMSDSEKRFNSSKNIPEVFTRIDDKSVSINALPALSEEPLSVPVSVRNRVDGPVTLSLNLREFNEAYSVFLEDTQAETWTNMRETSEYVYTPDELGVNNDRFVLHIQKVTTAITDPVQVEEKELEEIIVTGHETYARVSIATELLQQNPGNVVVEVFEMSGRLVKQVETRQELIQVDLPGKSGVYVVRVQVGRTVKSEKVMVQNR